MSLEHAHTQKQWRESELLSAVQTAEIDLLQSNCQSPWKKSVGAHSKRCLVISRLHSVHESDVYTMASPGDPSVSPIQKNII